MKRIALLVVFLFAAVLLVLAQRDRPIDRPRYEIKCLYPHEVAPGQFRQVDPQELEKAGDQGWRLVSVMPYVYRNEERGNTDIRPKPMVTQTYPAYFFERPRMIFPEGRR